jgi:hypothetical protein
MYTLFFGVSQVRTLRIPTPTVAQASAGAGSAAIAKATLAMLKVMSEYLCAMCWLLAVCGCATATSDVERELKPAKELRIGYFVDDMEETLTIQEPKKVQQILDTIHVTETRRGVQSALKPTGTIDFILEDGTSIQTMLVNSETLDRSHWGHIVLESTFYVKLCEVVSSAENEPIDLLKRNRSKLCSQRLRMSLPTMPEMPMSGRNDDLNNQWIARR